MATSIRGLTVEISADASKFNKAMKALKDDAKSTQNELNALQKSLELEFDSKKFEQAQKKMQEVIDLSAEKADFLRQRLKELEDVGAADTTHYRKIQADLAQAELEAQKLQQQFEKLNAMKFENLGNSIGEVGNKIANVGKALTPISALSAGALTGLGGLGIKAAATGAEIDDLSNRFGLSAEKIQEWQYLAMQTGVDVEVFNKALIKVRATMLDLATGTENNATKALQSLGLSMEQFNSQEEMFDGVINALAAMENKTLQAAYANEVFGDKIATQMLPFLNAGEEELAKFKEEFSSMSTLSSEQVSALATLDDTFNLLKESIKNVGLQIGASFAPLIKKIADTLQNTLIPKLQQLAGWFNSLSVEQQEMIAKALLLVAALAPVITIVGKLTSGVGNIINMIPKLSGALSSLAAHPVVLIIAAIAAILMVLYTQCEEFRESVNNLVSTLAGALQPVLDIIMGVLHTLIGLLTPIINMLGGILATIINMLVDSLTPFFEMLSLIFELLKPLINIALIPLQMALTQLQIPLQILGQLLGWLAPLFTFFAKLVRAAFQVVLTVINFVLGAVEDAINWVIGKINGLIDGVNSALGWLGVNIGRIQDVSLRIDTGGLDDIDDMSIDTTPPDTNVKSPDTTYDDIDTGNTTGDIYNYDYSQNNKTQNITVTIQNYAEEVDVDNLVNEINKKLAEAM